MPRAAVIDAEIYRAIYDTRKKDRLVSSNRITYAY